ncbi:MAG: hypothetical protein K0Q73_8105 [Paenibacillus sp.]|nr:hypothetical protein [Paenibacillus sp.]
MGSARRLTPVKNFIAARIIIEDDRRRGRSVVRWRGELGRAGKRRRGNAYK